MRDRFLGSLVLDSSVALHGDLIGTGAIARIRLAEVVELGGGVRVDDVRGHGVSTTGLFQIGLRMPLGEHDRLALPVGFEVGGGGAVDVDLRFPWGVRAMSGRWSVTLDPATPQYLHIEGEPRRWSIASGVELGASF